MLVDFFSLEMGKVSAVAKGIRNTKSDKKSLLQPFQRLQIELSGKSSLKTLGAVEALAVPVGLSGDMLFCGFYVNELLSRVLPENEAYSGLFSEYRLILAKLGAVQDAMLDDVQSLLRAQSILREFEFMLLETLGYLPDLSLDSTSQTTLLDDSFYEFDCDSGLVLSKVFGRGMQGLSIKHMLQKQWNTDALRVAKRITRSALLPLLGSKPLKSRELFSSVKTN